MYHVSPKNVELYALRSGMRALGVRGGYPEGRDPEATPGEPWVIPGGPRGIPRGIPWGTPGGSRRPPLGYNMSS